MLGGCHGIDYSGHYYGTDHDLFPLYVAAMVVNLAAPAPKVVGFSWGARGASAFKNLSAAQKALANNFMTQFGRGSQGATKLLDHIAKNGVPKIDKATRESLAAYRETIRAVGGNKTKTANSEVFQTRLQILNKVLGE